MRRRSLFGAVALAAIGLAGVSAPAGAAPALSLRATHYVAGQVGPPPTTASCLKQVGIACYRPFQIQRAYDMPRLFRSGLNGRGRTIVLVDSFGSPTIRRDLAVFDRSFHLPAPPSLRIIQPVGKVPPFSAKNPTRVGWAFETTLDVEWAHVMAPGARILLVETPVAETEGVQGFPQIIRAENYVINHGMGDVISQSFAATEETFPSRQALLGLRSAYFNAKRHHVTVLGASGDWGSGGYKLCGCDFYRFPTTAWPATDPLVTAVGGTQLHLNAKGMRTAPDNVWNDIPIGIDAAGGGGFSHVFSRPAFQRGFRTGADNHRAIPDISMTAAVNGGALVYVGFLGAKDNGFYIIGGTSEATPIFAGVVAVADQIAGHRLGWLNPRLYPLSRDQDGGIIDITRGNNTFTVFDQHGKPLYTVPGYQARRGYDMASGLGTVDGWQFTHELSEHERRAG